MNDRFDDLKPKILLSSSLTLARRFVQKKNLQGEVVLNYTVHNLFSLIQSLLIEVAPSIRLISDDESAYIFYKLISKKDYELKETVKSFGAASKLLDVLNDYRLNDNYSFSSLVTARYDELLKDYEQYLNSKLLIDYVFALKKVSVLEKAETIYLLSDISLRPLEMNVLKQVFSNVVGGGVDPKEKTLNISEIYEVYGQYGEVLNVLNYIEKHHIPTGDVEVLYTNTIFENLIKGTCDARKVPYTLKSSHAKMTNIVSFINDVLDYYQHDFRYELLEKVLSNQGLNPVYLKEFYQTISFPRYIVGESLKRSQEFIVVYEGVENISHFHELFKSIIEVVSDGSLNYEALLKIAFTYLSANKEREVLSNKLEEIKYIVSHEDDFLKKIEIIQTELESLSYSEKDSNGCISFSPISKSFTLRPYVFVIGLNQNLILGDDVENAFISDVNAFFKELGADHNIHLSQYQKRKKLENLIYYLSSSDSKIILSYSSDDKISLKDMTEGVYLLGIEPDKLPEPIKVNAYDIYEDNLKFKATYTSLKEEEVEQDYNNGEFKEVEDAVIKDIVELDITPEIPISEESKPFTLSPSAVKDLLTCPFIFYYSKVLKVISVQYPELNESSWLEPNARGTFFHRVMELYFNHFINKDIHFDKDLFEKCFTKAKDEALKVNPISNEYITLKEIDELHKVSKDYLESIIKQGQFSTYKVLSNELDLKQYKLSYSECNNLFFSGEIDRVDGFIYEGTLHLRIVDYKTGKYHSKDESAYYQHVLYSFIVESIEQKHLFGLDYDKIVVDLFIYDYPLDELKRNNEYLRNEFDENSPDYKMVFSHINNFVVTFLNNEKNYLSSMKEYFLSHYSEVSDNQSSMCSYCKYHKECTMRVLGGYKRWKENE